MLAIQMESIAASLLGKIYQPQQQPSEMQFYTRKRRTPFINIVSLIDILAILLIFFIVTTNFRKPQPQLKINLPDSKSAEEGAAAQKEPAVLRVKSETEISGNFFF
jgi:biopolymer transport protein ExbD